MEPPIQFARTGDGVEIAFWDSGEGTPLVAMPSMPWSHLRLEWTIPEVVHWYGAIGPGRRLIRYDGRGFGLSQHAVTDFGLDAQVRDLTAVIDKAGLERFDLYAGQHSGPPAIAFAAAHPERVAHLVLFCAYADGAAYSTLPVIQATRPMIHQDWEFYTEAVARLLLGWSQPDAASRYAAMVRECTTPELAAAALAATRSLDVTGQLADVAVPTLVMFRPQLRSASFEQSRLIASGIPGARLVLLEGDSAAPFLGDVDGLVAEVDHFLRDGTGPVPAPVAASGSGGLQTILFTDVVDSTTLTARLGDAGARRVFRRHEDLVRRALRQHSGREIKTLGDGFMAAFGSAVAAVECAVDLQRAIADDNASAEEPLRIRVGMDAGEPIAEDGDLFGTAVITASRIGARAEAGAVLVSDVVRQLVRGKGFQFEDRGEVTLRGLDEPVRLHAVVWEAPGT